MKMQNLIKEHSKTILALSLLIVTLSIALLTYSNMKNNEKKAAEQVGEERPILVDVLKIYPSNEDITLQYTAVLEPKLLSEESFTSIGTIKTIYVKEGAAVSKGQVLAQLDTEVAQRQVGIAENSMDSARAARDNAAGGQRTAQSEYDAAQKAPSAGQISIAKKDADIAKAELDVKKQGTATAKTELDAATTQTAAAKANADEKQAALDALISTGTADGDLSVIAARAELVTAGGDYSSKQMTQVQKQAVYTSVQREEFTAQSDYDTKQAYYTSLAYATTTPAGTAAQQRLSSANFALEQAEASYKNAASNYENAVKSLEDLKLKASQSGYIVRVVGSVGNIVSPQVPVVVIASNTTVASFGISPQDLPYVNVGQATMITVQETDYPTSIGYIDLVPDQNSRTYKTTADIPLMAQTFNIGETSIVTIDLGKLTAVWIPISVLMNDGEDYVFVVQDARAVKQRIKITDIANDRAAVEGLSEGGIVISEGMKLVRSGNRVEIKGE